MPVSVPGVPVSSQMFGLDTSPSPISVPVTPISPPISADLPSDLLADLKGPEERSLTPEPEPEVVAATTKQKKTAPFKLLTSTVVIPKHLAGKTAPTLRYTYSCTQ